MRKRVLVAAIILIFFSVAAKADEMSDLKQQIAELQQKVAAVEAKQTQQQVEVDERITKLAEKQSSVPDSLKWAGKIKFSGDFRYRHETINSQSSNKEQDGTNRNRIRLRLGLNAKINEEWDLGVRIATGSSDPASTNQSLDGGFAKKDIWLDLAYFDWHPKSVERLNVFGGKMPNPFYRAGNNQLVWDDDVNPEGIAAKYSMPFWGENNTLYLNGGGFWLKEDSGSAGGASVFGVQGYVKHDFENKNYMLGGLSYYTFGNLEGKDGLYKASGSGASKFGNTMTGAGTTASPYKYATSYDIVEAFGEYGLKFAGKPTKVYGSYIKNIAAATSEDTGWIIGTTFNKAKEPKSWELGYNYRDIEADATVGVLTDSDFVGGGTNGKGHCFSGKYQFTRNIQGALTYYLSKKGDAGDDYRRLMADIIFKF
jgi:hypothetical protein